MNHTLGIDYDMTQDPFAAWVTIITMDVWHWTSLVVLLSYAGSGLDPGRVLSGREDRRGVRGGRCSGTSSCRK